MEKLPYMCIKRHTQERLAALFKEKKAGNNPNIHPQGNGSIGFAHSPTNRNSAVKMNQLQLHATVWNNDAIFIRQKEQAKSNNMVPNAYNHK